MKNMVGLRLKQSRKNAGLTVQEAAEATSQSVETVRAHEKGARGVRRDVAARYARTYKVELSWLLGSTGEGLQASTGTMPVVGSVQAGAFREALETSDGEHEKLPVQFDAAYGLSFQFALKVEGRSMDQVYAPGTYVICVSVEESDPRFGDHVVCRRQRAGLYEFTLKELARDPQSGKPLLVPRSTDPAYQTPVSIIEGEVDVVAIVIGAYHSRIRRGPKAFG